MKVYSTLLALLLSLPAAAAAQPADLAGDLTGYARFVVFPHLQKGWESMERGDRDRAVAEFERARALAPDNAGVALHLAAAYRKFGEPGRAESVLLQQLTRTPDDMRLQTAIDDLRPAPPAASHPESRSPHPVPAASPGQGTVPARSRKETIPDGAQTTAVRPARVARPGRIPDLARTPPPPSDPAAELQAGFAVALGARRFDDAQRHADALLAGESAGLALLDELTYKLVAAGATGQAARTLLRTYPFAAGTTAERDRLLQRLIMLVEQQRTVLNDDELQPLRDPLDTPALRSRQAALWTGLQQCGTTRAVLGDMSPEYGHDDWMRLGDCSTHEAPGLALQAYALAQALQPGERASRALAYQAHAAQDYQTALAAWRTTGADRLSGDELLAATTTALAAGEHEQAASWLRSFQERGVIPDHRYWSLVAQTYAGSDTAAASAALERAIELRPEADDYVRLAHLETDPERQVRWLERAAALDGDNAHTQAALGFAYARAGRPASGLRAFERSAALDPNNMAVQIELGYAYSAAGRTADAGRAFERAWHADPANLKLAQQLVYVYQRLKENDKARGYVELVLDAPASFPEQSGGKDGGGTAADRRFGFQRLHEDLGRRVTVNLDGWSGTAVGAGSEATRAGSRYRSYSQVEADVRLGNPPIRNGSTLSAYARVFADGDLQSALPSQNAMLGVGLRWKPLRNRVLYLAAENQNGLDEPGRHDVLLRASASFLNGGPYGDDWHASPNGWFSRNLYLDAAQYLRTRHTAFTADYRTSYHRKVSGSATLEPYAHLQFNGSRSSRFDRDIRAGAGVRWNFWYGASRYDAAPHKVSVGVEFQQALDTYLSDRNGLFLSVGTRW
jgi:adsorption protein A